MITVEQARALGWQRVEFNDGLGFRPCTAVCAWNPEFQYREAYVRIDFEGLVVAYTIERAKQHFKDTVGDLLCWYAPSGVRYSSVDNPDFLSPGVYRAVRIKRQVKFEDLPLGTSLRHKSDILRGVSYEFRGVTRSTGEIRAEWRSNDKVLLHSFQRDRVYLSPDQSWLALGLDIPKGLVTQRHTNGYWWRIVKLEEGYELV